VLDHGLGRREERDELKELAVAHGATWKLLSFEADIPTLRARCQRRSDLAGSMPISSEALDYIAAISEPPRDEGETVVTTD